MSGETKVDMEDVEGDEAGHTAIAHQAERTANMLMDAQNLYGRLCDIERRLMGDNLASEGSAELEGGDWPSADVPRLSAMLSRMEDTLIGIRAVTNRLDRV